MELSPWHWITPPPPTKPWKRGSGRLPEGDSHQKGSAPGPGLEWETSDNHLSLPPIHRHLNPRGGKHFGSYPLSVLEERILWHVGGFSCKATN